MNQVPRIISKLDALRLSRIAELNDIFSLISAKQKEINIIQRSFREAWFMEFQMELKMEAILRAGDLKLQLMGFQLIILKYGTHWNLINTSWRDHIYIYSLMKISKK